MNPFTSALETFETIVGAPHLITATGGVATLTEGVSAYQVEGQMPLAVAHPGTKEEVAALLHAASQHGLSVLPYGAGQHIHIGSVPEPIGLLLSLNRLNQVVEYDAEDLTITVQAGLTLGELRRIIGEHNQMLPLDPPGPEEATIGGLAATNLSGPMRMRYGAPRDLILGLRAALSSGEIIRTGARTVKNVAGYDLTKLLVGSFGTLGAIVEVTLRLTPMAEERTLFAASLSPARARAVLPTLIGSYLDFATCDVVSFAAAQPMKRSLPLSLSPEQVVLFIGALGAPEALLRQERELKALFPEGVARLEREELWAQVRDFPYPMSKEQCVLRVHVPISSTIDMVELILAQPEWTAVARAGDGTVYAIGPLGIEPLVAFRRAAEKLGGHAVLEYGPPELKHVFPVWGEIANLDLMRALKRSLDPTDTMGCGRIL